MFCYCRIYCKEQTTYFLTKGIGSTFFWDIHCIFESIDCFVYCSCSILKSLYVCFVNLLFYRIAKCIINWCWRLEKCSAYIIFRIFLAQYKLSIKCNILISVLIGIGIFD